MEFDSLGDDIAMIAGAACFAEGNLKGCPSALASQIDNVKYGDGHNPDGYIFLNSDINWNCSFSNETVSEYNIPTMMLRGITKCLGFGSSILPDDDTYDKFFYSNGYPSYFDKLLYYGNKALTDLSEGSKAMSDFIKSNGVEAHTIVKKYRIYAPEEYVPELSLCYFEDLNSLMSYSFGQGNVNLSIDDKTLDILETLGWNLPSSSLKIKCDDISDNGIGSSYTSHVFSLLKGNQTVTDYQWRFLLKDSNGVYIQVSSGSLETFTIAAISSTDGYFVNIAGDLEGLIECDYTLNGSLGGTAIFPLSLELKPSIHSIDNVRIIKNGQYAFSVLFNVHYSGADYITVEVEEEYDTTLRNYRFDEPYIAHAKTGNISNLYYSWITVNVSNKYGTVSESFEYAPTMSADDNNVSLKHARLNSLNINEIKEVRLYDINGSMIFIGTQSEFLNRSFQSGLYIKKEIYENGTSKISKVLL